MYGTGIGTANTLVQALDPGVLERSGPHHEASTCAGFGPSNPTDPFGHGRVGVLGRSDEEDRHVFGG